ncbi:MAG: Tol-Pal system protein TolB [Rickettsiaceae bacterium]|nr:Tol-Pal system protein TolB [Rickettsiaceae bacterium]
MNIFSIILLLLVSITNSFADNIIDINQGKTDPLPIAINKFKPIQISNSLEEKITNIIKADLTHSGIFHPLPISSFIENKIGIDHRPVFASWQYIKAMLLLNGEIIKSPNNDGKVKIRFILWDTILEKPLLQQELEFNEAQWRIAAHQLANIIYKQITGLPGYFNSKITYVSETGLSIKRKKRIAIMDYDGHNHQYLTDGRDLVLTPRFSPDGKTILYLSYKNNIPSIYKLDVKSKKSTLLGNFPGMSFAPRFSPDGQYALMSIAKNGATHIYEMDLSSKHIKQLTSGQHINTSPSYSPDGSKIVFNSDRNGARQIFVMNRDGSGIEAISFGGGAYAEPLWSKQNYIVFTKMSRSNGFSIGIMKPELIAGQNNERLITNGYLVETPAWSGNGHMIIFARGDKPINNKQQKGLTRLYIIDFTGYNSRIVPTPYDASDPDWSQT